MKSLTFTNIEQMLDELNAIDRGRYFLCECPECNVKEAFIYKNNLKFLQCNRENECGERTYIEFKSKELQENMEIKKFEINYPNLTKKQRSDLKYVSEFVEHIKSNVMSHELDDGYRGLSRRVTESFIADLSVTNADGRSAIELFYEKSKSLLSEERDYSKSNHMLKRNLVIPITDENGTIERVLLRSSIDSELQPKEVQLILNPSKETKDFFVDLEGNSDVVVITEALFDGMSFKEVHPDINYLALTGVNRTRHLMSYLKKHQEAFEEKRIIVAMDNDKAGNRAKEKLLQFLEKEEIGKQVVAFKYPAIEGITDPNDLLEKDKELFKRCLGFTLQQPVKEMEVGFG